jgi:hypothetical protein
MRLPLACAALVLAGCGSAAVPASAPTPAPTTAAATAPASATTPAAPAQRGAAAFWGLVDQSRAAAGGSTERASELLEAGLRRLPPEQIDAFQRMREELDRRAYTWELWGAAYVIEDGCSDDCFRDFRAYLISLGRGPYEAALANPDSLARVVQDAETGDWENADDVAPEAYEDATGEDIPAGDSDVSGPPRGEAWDDDQADELVRRYPALAARFR